MGCEVHTVKIGLQEVKKKEVQHTRFYVVL